MKLVLLMSMVLDGIVAVGDELWESSRKERGRVNKARPRVGPLQGAPATGFVDARGK